MNTNKKNIVKIKPLVDRMIIFFAVIFGLLGAFLLLVILVSAIFKNK